MEEKPISVSESFQIIDTMIGQAKNRLADDGFMIIFWGWLVLAAALGSYVLLLIGVQQFYLTWFILMPLGGLFSFIAGRRERKRNPTRSHLDAYLGYVWLAFGIALFITLLFMGVHGMEITYFFVMLLYGVATLITGGLLNFSPLIIGSLFSFVAAILSVFCGFNEQFLCLSGSVLFSYIIPGHLLRANYQSQGV